MHLRHFKKQTNSCRPRGSACNAARLSGSKLAHLMPNKAWLAVLAQILLDFLPSKKEIHKF